jgi:predicted transcriptional regulator
MGHESSTKASAVTLRSVAVEASPELKRELLGAIAEIDRGECVELSPEQLERCIVDGEWPWPDESPG